MKKLPKLYKNNNMMLKNHNKNYCIVNKLDNKYENSSVNNIIEELLKNSCIYQIPLIIKTKDKSFVTRIVKVDNTNIYTIDNRIIKKANKKQQRKNQLSIGFFLLPLNLNP